jgi:hypothetical protein
MSASYSTAERRFRDSRAVGADSVIAKTAPGTHPLFAPTFDASPPMLRRMRWARPTFPSPARPPGLRGLAPATRTESGPLRQFASVVCQRDQAPGQGYSRAIRMAPIRSAIKNFDVSGGLTASIEPRELVNATDFSTVTASMGNPAQPFILLVRLQLGRFGECHRLLHLLSAPQSYLRSTAAMIEGVAPVLMACGPTD